MVKSLKILRDVGSDLCYWSAQDLNPGKCQGSHKLVPQERISETMCEQIVEVPKISIQESVEAVKKLSLRSEFLSRTCEQNGIIEVRKISGQECVEAVFRSAYLRGCVNRLGLWKCPRSPATRVEAVKHCLSGAYFQKDVGRDRGY